MSTLDCALRGLFVGVLVGVGLVFAAFVVLLVVTGGEHLVEAVYLTVIFGGPVVSFCTVAGFLGGIAWSMFRGPGEGGRDGGRGGRWRRGGTRAG